MNEIGPELKESSNKGNIGGSIEFVRRMECLWKDKKVKEGTAAFTRTVLNLGISLADFIPGGPGEVLDVIAVIGKTIKHKSGEEINPAKISMDLTPDVPTWIAWTSEAPEIVSGGLWPSYLVPTLLQGVKDVPRIVEGINQAIGIVKGEKKDYEDNRDQIQAALKVFSNNE